MILTADTAGERLDAFLARSVPDLSRSGAQKLLEDGCVTVGGKPAKKNHRLKPGEVICVTVPEPQEVVFMGWFDGGEVFRSGCTWIRGNGKVFYFQPGHETNPSYQNQYVQQIIRNAVRWCCPIHRKLEQICPNTAPVEPC